MLRAERLDESVWDELYQSVLDLSEPFDIVENMPRRCGRQTTRANHPADTPKQYWKVSLYYAFIDHMIMELESRLIKSENRFYAQYLLPRVIGNITNEQIATLYETYQTDLTCNLDEFKREVAHENKLPYICSMYDTGFKVLSMKINYLAPFKHKHKHQKLAHAN